MNVIAETAKEVFVSELPRNKQPSTWAKTMQPGDYCLGTFVKLVIPDQGAPRWIFDDEQTGVQVAVALWETQLPKSEAQGLNGQQVLITCSERSRFIGARDGREIVLRDYNLQVISDNEPGNEPADPFSVDSFTQEPTTEQPASERVNSETGEIVSR